MAIREILIWPDDRLKERCPAVTDPSAVQTLAQDLLDTMYEAKGRGLAAPQIGEMQRMFVMDCTWKEGTPKPQVFINPEILSSSEETHAGEEACLSIPEVTSWITRPAQIRLLWTDGENTAQEADFAGFEAICIQHEIDHLDGIVTLDRVNDAVGGEIRAWLSE